MIGSNDILLFYSST